MANKKAETYVVGNFKGGVGKSTTVQMLSFESAFRKHRKTLVIDLDPQGNTSDVLSLTAENFGNMDLPDEFDSTIWEAVRTGDIAGSIYNILPNLDLIPANISFSDFPDYMIEKYPSDKLSQFQYMERLIEPLKQIYDVIYIDVPPTISTYSNAAMYVAEYVIVILQTQVKSLKGAQNYIDYMNFFVEQYDTDLEVVGIVPFMMQKRDSVDQEIYETAKDIYGDHLLKTVVLNQSRLKRYDGSGITYDINKNGKVEQWDNRAHEVFMQILDEIDEHRILLSEVE
ncbi:cobyrinic acid a,c-diamide synthase [Enterococcus florum]|uniref:Cobyrinic acid a,c-diamide synthase n=1 Tax=Enterococcus florum TaxID=2480627 RepID=A0A4P5P586_9ENTE|nr:ParA family protein [Enterococcus florum]GCF92995.1 cobyrinic acid a,c-diamide synthase [Enterococcus florum]